MDLLQAAAFLRVSPTRLITAAEAGQVPAHRRAGRLLFRTAEVRAALATPIHPRPGGAGGRERDGGGGR